MSYRIGYQLGCYADFKGFCLTLIEITTDEQIKVTAEVFAKASLINIGKAITNFEKQYGVFDINLFSLEPLEKYLERIGKFYHKQPLDIASSVFLIACLCNDERLIIHETLKASYIEELASFDIDITSHRLNALALAIGNLDLNTMLGT